METTEGSPDLMAIQKSLSEFYKKYSDPVNDADVMIMMTHIGIGFLLTYQHFYPRDTIGMFIKTSLEQQSNSPIFWAMVSTVIAIGCAFSIVKMNTYLKLAFYAASIYVGCLLAIAVFREYGFNLLALLICIWLIYLPARTSRFLVQKTANELKIILRKLRESDQE